MVTVMRDNAGAQQPGRAARAPGLLKRLVGRTVMAALCLRVVHGEPSFRQHANKHVPDVFSPCLLDVPVTPLRAVVTVSEGPAGAPQGWRLRGGKPVPRTDVPVRAVV